MIESICQIPQGTPVLVTGATGFTGVNLTRKLVDAGLEVSAVARESSDISPLQDLRINWFRGDVFDEPVMKKAVAGQQYIFHVAAAFRDPKSSEKDYRDVHVRSTQIIAEESLKNPDFKRYIHVSTVGVHGHISHPPATEEYPFNPGDAYQRTKMEAEQWLNAFGEERKFPYTIIRPAAIYGPGDRRLLKLFRMALNPFFIQLGHGKCLYHLVHVDDLTNTLLKAATSPAALGETFISAASTGITIPDIVRIIAGHFGRKNRVLRLPIGPFFLLADICEFICRPLGVEPPIYRRRVAFFSKDRQFNVNKMRLVLGYEPRHGNEEGLVETADWYVQHGWLNVK